MFNTGLYLWRQSKINISKINNTKSKRIVGIDKFISDPVTQQKRDYFEPTNSFNFTKLPFKNISLNISFFDFIVFFVLFGYIFILFVNQED